MTNINVLFDLDGTLTDPGDGFVKCITYALSGLGSVTHSPSEIRKHIGPPLEETLNKLLGGDQAKVTSAVTLYRERYGSMGYLENSAYPGIEEVLNELQGSGYALFVATSKPSIYAKRILEHFGLAAYFRGIYGSDFDGTHSNKAHLIAHLVQTESLAPASTVMVGDRAHDVIGARANGVASVGALWGYGTREELAAAGAELFCHQPSLLREVLESWWSREN